MIKVRGQTIEDFKKIISEGEELCESDTKCRNKQ